MNNYIVLISAASGSDESEQPTKKRRRSDVDGGDVSSYAPQFPKAVPPLPAASTPGSIPALLTLSPGKFSRLHVSQKDKALPDKLLNYKIVKISRNCVILCGAFLQVES